MPDIQLITPEENRTFNTSIGNWTGDAIWEAGPVGIFENVAEFIMTPANTAKKMTLAYPYITTLPGKEHFLQFAIIAQFDGATRTCNWKLTDGSYTFQGSTVIQPFNDHEYIYEIIEIPADWNKTATTLDIQFEGEPDPDTILCCDIFSLIGHYEARIDYLPIMGVG